MYAYLYHTGPGDILVDLQSTVAEDAETRISTCWVAEPDPEVIYSGYPPTATACTQPFPTFVLIRS
jgi:hypothetical protein